MWSKGKGKANIYDKHSLGKLASPQFLKYLLANLSLYKEIKMEKLPMGAFSSLEDLFGGEVIQEAKETMKGITPFKMASMVHVFLFLIPFSVGFCCSLLTCSCGAQLGAYCVHMAKYYVILHHKFIRVLTLRDRTRALYDQVQAESWVPKI